MSGLDTLNMRVNYRGGKAQDRLISGKLMSLKRALLYSYQAATAILTDGREFRCLINGDKTKVSYDDKIISIPFEDICLNEKEFTKKAIGQFKTSEGLQIIGMKPGDVFTWKENQTDWLVYLQRLEEKAYFRAEIRKCDYEVALETEDKTSTYKAYIRKRELDEIEWHTAKGVSWNDINYSLQMYLTKDATTIDYFHRFKIVKINDKPWEVQAVDEISTEGIIIIALKEYFTNTIEDEIKTENENKENNNNNITTDVKIKGKNVVYPYDNLEYTIENAVGGQWFVSNNKAIITEQTEEKVLITITTGRSGEFELIYKRENEEDIVFKITIESL